MTANLFATEKRSESRFRMSWGSPTSILSGVGIRNQRCRVIEKDLGWWNPHQMRAEVIEAVIGSWRLLSERKRKALILLATGNLFLNTLDIVAIGIIGLVGAVSLGGSPPLTLISVSDLETETLVLSLLALAAVMFTVKTVVGVFLARTQFTFLAKTETMFSEKIAKHVLGGDISAVKGLSRADLEWSILRSTNIAFSRVLGRSLVLISEFGLAALILGLFFYTDWVSAAILSLYFLVVLGLLQLVAHVRSATSGSLVAEGSVAVSQAVADSIAAFKEISVLSRVSFFVQKIRNARAQAAIGGATQAFLQTIPRLVMELALTLGAVGFAVFLYLRDEGDIDSGLLSVFVVGSLRLMSALLPLQRAFTELRFFSPQALGAQRIIREALAAEKGPPHGANLQGVSPSPLEIPSFESLGVEVLGVSFSYRDRGDSDSVLHDISLKIEPGQIVALIGPSGAGKSTLCDLILGLHTPSHGEILLNGVAPKVYREAKPGVVGYVPQKPGLVSGSVRENVALGIPIEEINDDSVTEALNQAEIADFVNSLPRGAHSSLGQHADSLSGGQIQRIGLARALYTKPQLLILDEATSALDAEIEASITSSLKALRQKTTIVVVAHRLSTVQDADVVIVLDKGLVVAAGSLGELQQSSPIVKKYVSLMAIE